MEIKRAIDARSIEVPKQLAADVLSYFSKCLTETNPKKLRHLERSLVAQLIPFLHQTDARGVAALTPDNTTLYSADPVARSAHYRLRLHLSDNLSNTTTPYNVWVYAK